MIDPEKKDALLRAASAGVSAQDLALIAGVEAAETEQLVADARPPATKSIPLRTPITIGDEAKTSLDLREPTAGEIDDMGREKSPAIWLLAQITGIPPAFVRNIPASEYNAAWKYLGSFL